MVSQSFDYQEAIGRLSNDPDARESRLLALHRAIAHILFLSGAGEYINKILDDFDKTGVRADGTTELGRMVSWRMSGCLGGIAV